MACTEIFTFLLRLEVEKRVLYVVGIIYSVLTIRLVCEQLELRIRSVNEGESKTNLNDSVLNKEK